LLCTACINNLAIQELNQNGKQYLEKGDYDAAIARFQSSVDLDENLFESRYNLGVAYINKKDYEKAIQELKIANTLNPNSADCVYSYAVALESEGLKIEETEEPAENTGEAFNAAEDAEEQTADPADIIKSVNLIKSAIELYEKYITMIDSTEEKGNVKAHIAELNEAIIRIKGETPDVRIPTEDE